MDSMLRGCFWRCFNAFAQGHKSFTITNTSWANISSVDMQLHSALTANVFTWSEKGWYLYHHLILFLGTYSCSFISDLSDFRSALLCIKSSNWAALHFEVLISVISICLVNWLLLFVQVLFLSAGWGRLLRPCWLWHIARWLISWNVSHRLWPANIFFEKDYSEMKGKNGRKRKGMWKDRKW